MDPFDVSGLIVDVKAIDKDGKTVTKELFGAEAEAHLKTAEQSNYQYDEVLVIQRYFNHEPMDGSDLDYDFETEDKKFCNLKFSFESVTFCKPGSPVKTLDWKPHQCKKPNPCTQEKFDFQQYVMQKWSISRDSEPFIVGYIEIITGQHIKWLLEFADPGGCSEIGYHLSDDEKHLYLFEDVE